MDKDLNQANNFYEKACYANFAKGCFNLAASYNNGEGVKKNKSQAKYFFSKACDLGYKEGCKHTR